MALLNDADALYMGDLEVDAVYVGDVQVWPTGDAWSFYRELTISNMGGAAKSDWPVRVDLTGVTGDGSDLQFRAADGVTVLDHWVEAWPICWVKVPTIGADTTATVRAYYGNDAAVDASDGAAVFATLFEDFDDPDASTPYRTRRTAQSRRSSVQPTGRSMTPTRWPRHQQRGARTPHR